MWNECILWMNIMNEKWKVIFPQLITFDLITSQIPDVYIHINIQCRIPIKCLHDKLIYGISLSVDILINKQWKYIPCSMLDAIVHTRKQWLIVMKELRKADTNYVEYWKPMHDKTKNDYGRQLFRYNLFLICFWALKSP